MATQRYPRASTLSASTQPGYSPERYKAISASKVVGWSVKKIAVVGGGPKAAAICAKAWCLNQDSRQLRIQVFEKSGFGAAWNGRHGYTDGDQKLCTPAERDVGFPYEEGLLAGC